MNLYSFKASDMSIESVVMLILIMYNMCGCSDSADVQRGVQHDVQRGPGGAGAGRAGRRARRPHRAARALRAARRARARQRHRGVSPSTILIMSS